MFKCEDDFNEAMQALEADFARDEVPLHARAFRAEVEICRRSGQQFASFGNRRAEERDPTPGVYSGEDLIIRVRRWYRDRFEGMEFDSRRRLRFAVLLQGDPWSLVVPVFWGTASLICEPQLDAPTDGTPVINIPDQFDNLPRGVRAAVRADEWQSTTEVFALAIAAAAFLRAGKKFPLMWQAFLNIEATAFHLTSHPRNLGEARWSSLQAAEKALKAIAEHRRVPYSKGADGHVLSKLVTDIEAKGPLGIDHELLKKITCRAGVRYGEIPVRLDEAIEAHHAVLRLLAVARF